MINKIAIVGITLSFVSCNDLDLLPLSQGSSEGWYSDETEILMSLNDGYNKDYWHVDDPLDGVVAENWTDDGMIRQTNTSFLNGTLTGQEGIVVNMWNNQYKAIARVNLILANMEKAESLGISEHNIKQYTAEACFLRACRYSSLVSHFGDIPYVTDPIEIEEAFAMGRSSKSDIIPYIYADFDRAIQDLPVSYPSTSLQRATKGAALALKARFALYMGDWKVAAEAAKACMELSVYSLHADFSDLFLVTTRNAEEAIFVLPRSLENDTWLNVRTVQNFLPRNCGGFAYICPSWDLFASFLCTDGLPIDESPLFDPHEPFKNRDPRCTATIVPFGEIHLGIEYNPRPDAVQVMNYATGKMITNNDSQVNAQYASFNALLFKKGIDNNWLLNSNKIDPDRIIMRYAEVLLIYAEAKIELNEIDQSVLDAINMVRARAYKAKISETDKYPVVVTVNQQELRKIVRIERRMEFVNEGLRYMDLVRWRLASIALTKKNYGILYPASLLQEKVVDEGGWFWPSTPQMDENGVPDFSEMEKAGQIRVLTERNWIDRQYLWPIPTKEILINDNLKQNPGY